MRNFTVAMRHTIEYEIEVDADGFDGAVATAKKRAKEIHLPKIKRAVGVTRHNDDEQKVTFVFENDEG